MKTLIIILIITSFIQSSILPLDLILLVLISRSLLRPDRTNLFLAFGFGLLTSHLNLTPLGFDSLIYLVIVEVLCGLSKSRLSPNFYLIIPISLGSLFLHQQIISLLTHTTFHFFPKIFIEGFLSLPIFFLIKIWEERFIVRHEIKLRV